MARQISQALVTAALMTAAAFSSTAAIADRSSPVIDPTNVIAGRTYADWSAAWWQWVASIPPSSNPLFDNGDCTTGQTGQVFFLGGNLQSWRRRKRRCTVPKGKNIYFPIVNEADAVPNATDTINIFREANQSVIDGATKLEADLDGKRIDAFRVQSTVFSFLVLTDNIFGISAGTYDPAVDDGVVCHASAAPARAARASFHGDLFSDFFAGCYLPADGLALNVRALARVLPHM